MQLQLITLFQQIEEYTLVLPVLDHKYKGPDTLCISSTDKNILKINNNNQHFTDL